MGVVFPERRDVTKEMLESSAEIFSCLEKIRHAIVRKI
jgi:hypothetical protein